MASSSSPDSKFHRAFRSLQAFFKPASSRSRIDAVSPSSTGRFWSLSRLFQRKSKPTAMSVFSSNQPAPSSSPPIVLFSVLGVAGPLQNENAGRMILDWMIFTTLLASLAGFDGPRFRYRSIRDVIPLFPDQTFLFGEAGSDRLRFRVPSCLFDEHAQKNEVFDAEDFVCSCFLDIAASASRVQSGEKFILLLIGHGERTRTGEFRLCVTTESNRLGEAWLSKRQLELAVAECRGQITVICNSCHSGALESPRWQFVCAAGPNELAEALTTSASGNVRGSAFSLCALAEVGQEQGLVMPFSRSETRPVGTADEDIYHLTGGSSSMVTLVRISNRVDSARHRLHLLAPPFSPIPKSLRRDKQDADLCRRFLHDSKSLAEGEILDFASSLLTRHIQSVVIQLISMELGWSPSSNVTPFLSLEDANSGEFFIDEMIENGIPLDDLALCLLAHFEGLRSSSDRASVWWIAKMWDSVGRPKVSPEEWKKAVDTAVEEATIGKIKSTASQPISKITLKKKCKPIIYDTVT